jgi:hypothetical protein
MRSFLALSAIALGLSAQASAQTCTGLCLQQVSCPAGQTTSISGTVYAPNNTDPLPNVVVYIPNSPVDAFTPGVSCPVPGKPPSGSPLVGTTTATDGTFKLINVPVGSNIPIVIQAGRWRRQVVVPSTAACTDTAFSTRMPQNQSEGDIPKIAIVTGAVDEVECILRKVGVSDSEFTNPSGSGRVHLYSGACVAGARIDATTPKETALTNNPVLLNQYDVLMLPCQGQSPPGCSKSSAQLANFTQYANAGGRVYASHYGYGWMYQNPPFNGVVNWQPSNAQATSGMATVDTSFPDGQTLAQWLMLVGASTTQGQISIDTIRHDLNGVVAPTQSWLTLNTPLGTDDNPVMQFTFNTPVGATNQCGRILFNEYHVENPPGPNGSSENVIFPNECSSTPMTAQEKLLEFSLFNLTNEGGEPSLSPTTYDFGNEAVGFTSAPQTFTVKNTSIFALSITSVSASGDFLITSNPCTSIPASGSCAIQIAFKPTALGTRTGTLTVTSSANPLTASLKGTGIPTLAVSANALNFGSLDVGASSMKSITLINTAPGPVALPPLVTTGDYSLATNCPATIPAASTCTLNITFTPTATGMRSGSLTLSSGDPASAGLPAALTGNGIDFSIAVDPNSGSTIAGYNTSTKSTVTPIAGFSAPVTLSCTTTAPASTCTPSLVAFTPAVAVSTTVSITTTSKYTVIGYGGFGSNRLLSIFAITSGSLLFVTRRRVKSAARLLLFALFLASAALSTTGCSGKYPDQNSVYTPAGTYAYTVTATDGFLKHSATFQLKVTAN